jgi:hypothetical protein
MTKLRFRERCKSYLLPFIGASFVFGLIANSEPFQTCEHVRKWKAAYHGLRTASPLMGKILARLGLHISCTLSDGGVWEILSGFAVAIFTFTLWRSTLLLWKATERQRRDNKLSIRAAITAASASTKAAEAATKQAKTAEDALVKLEIPRVYPSNFSYNPENSDEMMSFQFKNYGRSPAILEKADVVLSIWPTNNISHKLFHCQYAFMVDGMIGERDFSDPIVVTNQVILQHRENIDSGITTLGLSIGLRHRDLLGSIHFGGTWYIWHYRRKRFVQGLQLWDIPHDDK